MRITLIAAVFLASIPLSKAAGSAGTEAYLLFPPEFRVVEITRLGTLPLLAAGNLVEKFARARFEAGFTAAYRSELVELDDVVGVDTAEMGQSLALLKRVTRVLQQHLDPEDDGTFFENGAPEFIIGPAFAGARIDGHSLEFGLTYSVVQYSYDGVRTRRLFGGDESEGFLVTACIVRLDDGLVDHCRIYSEPGGYLLHRAGYFEGDRFSEYVAEMLTDGDHVVHRSAGK